jgi:2-dehydropantoate 2-reductase
LPTRTINVKVPALHLCQVAEIREPFDLVFLIVKAYDTKWACQLIEPCLAPDGLVGGLQNGMTHEDIAAIVGRERTIGAVIEIASNMFVPGVTNRQNDHDTSWFALGALDPKTQERVESVAELLRNTGTVEVTDDIRSAKWMILVVNAAELIPSAITNLPLADAARAPGMLEVMREAGYEAMLPWLMAQRSFPSSVCPCHNQSSGSVRRSDFRGGIEDILSIRHPDDLAPGLAQRSAC